MSRYRKIDPRIWNDARFRLLSDNGKLAVFLLLTHPNMTALGAMRATLPGLAAELGWSTEAFRQAFAEASAQCIVEHDEEACFIGLPKFLRYNQPESPNVVKAWAAAVDLLPECDLKSVVLQRAQGFAEGMSEAFSKAFREAFPKAMRNQEQEQEQELNKSKSPKGDSSTTNVVVASSKQKDLVQCPHEDIIALYHEALPELRRVSKWTPQRQKTLRARWREDKTHQSLDWWRSLFGYVRQSDFLMGRIPGRNGQSPFEADLEWIVRPQNLVKIIEGAYENRGVA
jgi:Sec-independent protein translocase protein TatA